MKDVNYSWHGVIASVHYYLHRSINFPSQIFCHNKKVAEVFWISYIYVKGGFIYLCQLIWIFSFLLTLGQFRVLCRVIVLFIMRGEFWCNITTISEKVLENFKIYFKDYIAIGWLWLDMFPLLLCFLICLFAFFSFLGCKYCFNHFNWQLVSFLTFFLFILVILYNVEDLTESDLFSSWTHFSIFLEKLLTKENENKEAAS